MISIASKREGFRRCGVAHTKGPVEYKDGAWDEEQLETLKAEPMLVVTSSQRQETGGANAPALSEEAQLQAAIASLDVMDITLWTEGGKPQVKVIEAVLGRQISAADRDVAWKIFEGNREASE